MSVEDEGGKGGWGGGEKLNVEKKQVLKINNWEKRTDDMLIIQLVIFMESEAFCALAGYLHSHIDNQFSYFPVSYLSSSSTKFMYLFKMYIYQ